MNSIHIGESLAKGLKSRFFTELPEELNVKIDAFAKSLTKKNSPKLWEHYAKSASSIFSNHALSVYLGGSKRKPYLGICALRLGTDRDFKNWKEDFVTSYNVILNYEPREVFDMTGVFILGEHVVSRLYQRSRLRKGNDQLDIDFILPELRCIPVWAAYWTYAFHEMHDRFGIERLSAIIPGSTGLFFADCSTDSPFIEIRTFVGDDQLTYPQQASKESMLAAATHVQSSVLSLGVLPGSHLLDENMVERCYLSSKIRPVADAVSSCIFQHVEDDQDRHRQRDTFIGWLKDYATVDGELVDAVEQGRLRELHIETKSRILKENIYNMF
jgi:hypothetical protein